MHQCNKQWKKMTLMGLFLLMRSRGACSSEKAALFIRIRTVDELEEIQVGCFNNMVTD